MELRYLVDRPVGIYAAGDVSYVLRMLAKDEDANTDEQRLRLFRLGLCTPLTAGALVHIVEEGAEADKVVIIDGGPKGPFWVGHEFIATISEYVRDLDDRNVLRRPLPHELLKAKPRAEATPIASTDLPEKPARKRSRASRPNLSLDDEPPAGFDSLFDVEAA